MDQQQHSTKYERSATNTTERARANDQVTRRRPYIPPQVNDLGAFVNPVLTGGGSFPVGEDACSSGCAGCF